MSSDADKLTLQSLRLPASKQATWSLTHRGLYGINLHVQFDVVRHIVLRVPARVVRVSTVCTMYCIEKEAILAFSIRLQERFFETVRVQSWFTLGDTEEYRLDDYKSPA
jgi:hypothetical protein